MADGSRTFNFPPPQSSRLRPGEIVIDLFAGGGGRTWSAMDPLRTQCAQVKGGHFAVVAPTLVKFKGDSIGHPITDPVPTITAGGACKRPAGAAHSLALMSAFLNEACTGEPGQLDPAKQAGAERVAAFLLSYYGNGGAPSLADPLDTITTRDRMALVTVMVRGTPYVVTDIRLRMLRPDELFRAQGFPPDYIIERTADGRRISNTHAVRMVGNSVSPPPLRAIAEANLDPVINQLARAA